MNEKHVQELVEIERQAQALLDSARRDAERLPVQAEREAHELLERARSDARAQAQEMIDDARGGEEGASVLLKAQDEMQRDEKTAAGNLDQAVEYVMARLLGVE